MEIIKDNLVPKSGSGAKLKYPWDTIKVNECYEAICTPEEEYNKRMSLLNAAKTWARLNKPIMKFVTRKTKNGIAIWRVQ